VDRVTTLAVEGWAADLENPEALAAVVCRGSDGASLTFRAHVSRQDVQEHLGVAGRFGFAFPRSGLSTLADPVTFTHEDGSVLLGGERVMLQSPPTQTNRSTIVVLHIQKTAGTSLRIGLTAHFEACETALVYPDLSSGLRPGELLDLPEEQRCAFRLVIGHIPFGTAGCLPGPAEYVTFLRRPEARLRSNYRHHLSAGTFWDVDDERLDVREVAQRGISDEFDNLMTRMLAGRSLSDVPSGEMSAEHVTLALQNLRTQFRFVGLQERMAVHYGILCDVLDLPRGVLGYENKRPMTESALFEADVDWDVVMHANRFDVLLYDAVLAEGLSGRDLHPSVRS
jgi:hypothetical protein